MMNNYKEWVPRVSDIVSYIFPFEWEDKIRYQKWLYDKWINEEEYLTKANEWGTYVHKTMEDYIWKNKVWINNNSLNNECNHWIDFINNNLTQDLETEVFVIDEKERFQGTFDLVEWITPIKVKLYDWKTYWIAKKYYELDNKYTKPYWKLKKTALQLSLYADTFRQRWIEVESISCVYLHETWAYEYPLTLYSTEEINEILEKYYSKDIPEEYIYNINFNTMIIEIRKPTETYWFINLTIDMYKETSWIKTSDKIDQALTAINYTLKKLKWE